MKIDIQYRPAYSLAIVDLAAGESVQAESGAMVSMTGNIGIETAMKGGLLGAVKRKILGGESLFANTYTAQGAPGQITLAPSLPGDVQRYAARRDAVHPVGVVRRRQPRHRARHPVGGRPLVLRLRGAVPVARVGARRPHPLVVRGDPSRRDRRRTAVPRRYRPRRRLQLRARVPGGAGRRLEVDAAVRRGAGLHLPGLRIAVPPDTLDAGVPVVAHPAHREPPRRRRGAAPAASSATSCAVIGRAASRTGGAAAGGARRGAAARDQAPSAGHYDDATPEISDASTTSSNGAARGSGPLPGARLRDSPTRRVGGRPAPWARGVPHRTPMLSSRMPSTPRSSQVRCAPEAPSTSMRSILRRAQDRRAVDRSALRGRGAVRAVTRGDGVRGEIVTHGPHPCHRCRPARRPLKFLEAREVYLSRAGSCASTSAARRTAIRPAIRATSRPARSGSSTRRIAARGRSRRSSTRSQSPTPRARDADRGGGAPRRSGAAGEQTRRSAPDASAAVLYWQEGSRSGTRFHATPMASVKANRFRVQRAAG